LQKLANEIGVAITVAHLPPGTSYRRNGTANLFVFLDAHRSWRHVKVTDHRTARDFAHIAS
jgi:hypothetical protein